MSAGRKDSGIGHEKAHLKSFDGSHVDVHRDIHLRVAVDSGNDGCNLSGTQEIESGRPTDAHSMLFMHLRLRGRFSRLDP